MDQKEYLKLLDLESKFQQLVDRQGGKMHELQLLTMQAAFYSGIACFYSDLVNVLGCLPEELRKEAYDYLEKQLRNHQEENNRKVRERMGKQKK